MSNSTVFTRRRRRRAADDMDRRDLVPVSRNNFNVEEEEEEELHGRRISMSLGEGGNSTHVKSKLELQDFCHKFGY